MSRIVILDYQPEWAPNFDQLKAVYESQLSGLILDIQHVGSTSVPGLAAKPVIDIDIIIEDAVQLPPVAEKLATLGYIHAGDLGIEGREAFKYIEETERPKHNLYVCIKDCISVKNHIAFRDFLLSHPEAVKQYGDLKRNLAQQHFHSIDLYVEGKTDFITHVLRKAGFDEDSLQNITNANKAHR